MKQTAVDKFHDAVNDMIARIRPMTSNEAAKIWAECKEMEKEQVKEAYNQGYRDAQIDGPDFNRLKDVSCFDDAEQYYNETYGGKL